LAVQQNIQQNWLYHSLENSHTSAPVQIWSKTHLSGGDMTVKSVEMTVTKARKKEKNLVCKMVALK